MWFKRQIDGLDEEIVQECRWERSYLKYILGFTAVSKVTVFEDNSALVDESSLVSFFNDKILIKSSLLRAIVLHGSIEQLSSLSASLQSWKDI